MEYTNISDMLITTADAYNTSVLEHKDSHHTDYLYGKFQGMIESVEQLGNDVSYEFDGSYIHSVTINGEIKYAGGDNDV